MSVMLWRSSKKKPESHGCCHYCQYVPEPCSAEEEKLTQKLTRTHAGDAGVQCEKKFMENRANEGGGEIAGYIPYVKLKSNVKPVFVLWYQMLVMSPMLLLSVGYFSVYFATRKGGVTVEGVRTLYSQSSSGLFREEILGVCGFVIGAVMALAALSWVRHRRPENPHHTRMWIVDILDDSLKEMVSFCATVVLSSLFGVLTIMYWISVFSARQKGDHMGGAILIGSVLIIVSVVVYSLPLLLSTTGNVPHRERVRTLQDIISYSRFMSVVRGWGECKKLSRLGIAVRYASIFVIASISMGISWWLWGGRNVSVVAVALYVGVIAVYFVCCKIYFSIKLIIRSCFSRSAFLLLSGLFCVSLLLIFWAGMTEVSNRSKDSFLAVLAGFWWIVPIYFYGILRRVPMLASLNSMRLCREIESLAKSYEQLFSGEVGGDRDVVAIVNEVLPVGVVLRKKDRSGWVKPWSRRAVMMVPEAGKPRKPGPYDVDLRAYIAKTFDIVLPGTGAPVLPSRVRSSNGAIDEWHVDSLY